MRHIHDGTGRKSILDDSLFHLFLFLLRCIKRLFVAPSWGPPLGLRLGVESMFPSGNLATQVQSKSTSRRNSFSRALNFPKLSLSLYNEPGREAGQGPAQEPLNFWPMSVRHLTQNTEKKINHEFLGIVCCTISKETYKLKYTRSNKRF